jgi:hypothetical protein
MRLLEKGSSDIFMDFTPHHDTTRSPPLAASNPQSISLKRCNRGTKNNQPRCFLQHPFWKPLQDFYRLSEKPRTLLLTVHEPEWFKRVSGIIISGVDMTLWVQAIKATDSISKLPWRLYHYLHCSSCPFMKSSHSRHSNLCLQLDLTHCSN